MADRVDKSWQQKGLESYSPEAIFGTLAHYGVTTDEAAFRDASRDAFPAKVAQAWLETWKGTGQFKGFPYAAALALYKRFWPDRLLPTQYADGLGKLITEVSKHLHGDAKAQHLQAFDELEALSQKLPEPSRREDFMDEVVLHLGEEGTRAFDENAEALARGGQKDLALRFARLEEQLLPDRRGIAEAIVRAAAGEKDAALGTIGAVFDEGDASTERKVMAVDALIHLDAFEEARRRAEPLLDAAEKAQDFHLALALCERLAHVYDKLQALKELRALADRASALAKAHDAVHPHHH